MTSPLATLEPRSLWNHFDQLRQIPRPSKHEEKVLAHIKTWAESNKFEWLDDEAGNVCVRVPATKGHEKAPTIVIQGHVDIVAEKDNATVFDFLTDPIQCRVDGDWVIAEKTTLGADNGIGVAAALAAADDPSVTHGPLELLFTIDEETGLTGATNLNAAKLLKGKIMLNLDSEEDGVLFVGCAGGAESKIELDLPRTKIPTGFEALKINVSGLKGGHSGLNIIDNRANSIKVMARLISSWQDHGEVLVCSIEGGTKHNAIPRESEAFVVLPSAFMSKATALTEDLKKALRTEYKGIDDTLDIQFCKQSAPLEPATPEASRRLTALLLALPDGVSSMSRDIEGLVETSSNLAIIKTESGKAIVTTSSRSSVASGLQGVLEEAKAVVTLAGGLYRQHGGYPAWQPNMSSTLLKTCKAVFHELYGHDPKVTAIHAGLECGIIGEKIGEGADMISFGPQLAGVHAPGEKVQISTVSKFWDLYKGILKHLAS